MPSLFYNSVRTLVRPLIRAFWAPRVTGLEHVPATGGFLIASNHLANVDSFLIPAVMPRQVRFVAKDTLWQKKGPAGAAMRWFFDEVGSVPVDREELASGRGALEAALGILRDGDGFAIYPEGTRSKDGLLHPGRQGAAWLALEAGCPVVPVGLRNTQHLFGEQRRAARGAVSVRVGAPLTFEDLDPSLSKGARRRAMTVQIMDAIAELSGQRRVDGRPTTPRSLSRS